MADDPKLRQLLLEARARVRVRRTFEDTAAGADLGGPLVQLGVRIPERLRSEVRRLAGHDGISVQSWVTAALEDAVRRSIDPHAQAAAAFAEDARHVLNDYLESGAYAEAQAAFDDLDSDAAIG